MSIRDILRESGDQIPKKAFLKILMKRLGISKRTVYRRFDKALERGDIEETYRDDGILIIRIPREDLIRARAPEREEVQDQTFNRREALWMALVETIPDWHGGRAWRKFAETYRWIRKGAPPEEKPRRLDGKTSDV